MASSKPTRPVKERFESAVTVIKSLPSEGPFQPSNLVKLRFYALYKQATQGACDIPQPGFWDVTGRAKWQAWNTCGQMSDELAMQMYVEELQRLIETMPQTEEVEQFLKSIGPFYEIAEDESEDNLEPSPNPTDPSNLTNPTDPNDLSNHTVQFTSESVESDKLQLEDGSSRDTDIRHHSPGQTSEPSKKVLVDDEAGESGDESDSSVEFKDSFQELKNGTEVSTTPPISVSQQRMLSGISQTDRPNSSRPLSSSQGQETLTRSHRTPRTVTFSLPHEQPSNSNPGLTHGPRGVIHLSSPASYPIAIESVTSEISRLQGNIKSMLQQLNTLALAVNGLSQAFPQSRNQRVREYSSVSSPSPPQMVPQLVTRTGRLLTLCIKSGPILMVWPAVVSIVMAYLTRRFISATSLPPPGWMWGVFAVLQAVFTLLVAHKASR